MISALLVEFQMCGSTPAGMLVIAMVVCLSEDKINIFGSIEDLYVRGIVYQAIHPYLFEADIANAEICFTVSQRNELLGGVGS